MDPSLTGSLRTQAYDLYARWVNVYPEVSVSGPHSPRTPSTGILPYPGFREYIPQKFAGILKLPPISLPQPSALPSIPSNAPSPPDDPPQVCAELYGLRVRPQVGLTHSQNISACGRFVFTNGMPPASRTSLTTCCHRMKMPPS